MSHSPDTHLFYGYVWDGETSLYSLLQPDDGDGDGGDRDSDSDDWQRVLLTRRGYTYPWSNYPSREALIQMGRAATDEQYESAVAKGSIWNPKRHDNYTCEQVGSHIFQQTPGFVALYETWEAARDALEGEFSCDLAEYGSSEVPTAYLYVKDAEGEKRSFKSSWDGPTPVDPAVLAAIKSPTWDTSLRHFIDALDLPMDGGEWHEPPVGPGWFMVTSYG